MKEKSKIKRFLEGIAEISIFQSSIIDPTEGKTDEELLRQDWIAIGCDIKRAIEKKENHIKAIEKGGSHIHGKYEKTIKAC